MNHFCAEIGELRAAIGLRDQDSCADRAIAVAKNPSWVGSSVLTTSDSNFRLADGSLKISPSQEIWTVTQSSRPAAPVIIACPQF
jgi:hypothetical protein